MSHSLRLTGHKLWSATKLNQAMTAGCLEIIRSPPETGKQKPVQKREILAERQMNQGGFVDFSNYNLVLFTNNIF